MSTEPKLSLARVLRGMLRTFREQAGLVIGAGLLIFIPLALLDVLVGRIQGPLNVDEASLSTFQLIESIAALSADAAAQLVGSIFYSGVVAAAVLATREGRDHSLARIARTLPYRRLIVIDLVISVAVAVGLLLLIVPGLFLFARLVLSPAVEVEGLSVRSALRRSWGLTRGHGLRVLALMVPVVVLQGVLSAAVQSSEIVPTGGSFLGDWVGATVSSVVSSPLYALAVVVLFFELRDLRAERTGPSGPRPAAAHAPASPGRAP